MAIKNAANKDMADVKTKENKALAEYFFAGGMEYYPITILAASQAEAEELYIKQRVPVNNTNN